MELGVNGFKIASCDITNKPLLGYVARTNKPIFLSTGAAEISEIHRAVDTLIDNGTSQFCIMHCTLCYPTNIVDANLSALLHLRREFPTVILGLSDHTLESETPSYAVMLGARVIEKHFTFDKSLPLSADHWLSVDEEGMKSLIEKVRFAESSYGTGKKEVLQSERLARQNARRSLVASRDLPLGHILSPEDIENKRPGTGLDPYSSDLVVGRILNRSVEKDHIIALEDLI
jgi:sialic acid synthase SpsE